MRIVFSEEQRPADEIVSLFERAAVLALVREGIACERLEVSFSYASPEEMEALNAQYRGAEGPTDVLSFPMYKDAGEISEAAAKAAAEGAVAEEAESEETAVEEAAAEEAVVEEAVAEDAGGEAPVLIGDVVICREVAERQAKELGHSLERELLYLFVHSMFHLLGYDHEVADDKRRAMREAEKDVMKELGEEADDERRAMREAEKEGHGSRPNRIITEGGKHGSFLDSEGS